MAPPLQLSIPRATTTSPPNAHTAYTITLSTPLRTTTLTKRYSDFPALHSALLAQVPHNTPPPAPLPPKSWSLFRSSTTSLEQVEQRRRGLEAYLQAIQNAPDPRWRVTAAWRAFLNLPANRAGSPSSLTDGMARGANGRTGTKADVTIDPSVWLDIHRDVKSALRSARLAVTARDQAPNAQAQHESAAEAKRCLVRAGTMLSTLDAGLTSLAQGGGADGARKLGDGEVRRRRDLLSSARKERDGVEAALAATTTRTATNGAQAGAPSAGARNALLSPDSQTNSSMSPHPSRRVLGSRTSTTQPAQETAKTRELDNAGVLALQQEVMSEQDADVTELTRTVARMKEMGVRIGEEVEVQNEMLGLVEGDVDRVGDKIKVARGRVSKIK